MAENQTRVVDKNGLLAFFIKYRGANRAAWTESQDADQLSLVCLHHYEQIVLFPRIGGISRVNELTGRSYWDAVSAKWMLTYRMTDDCSHGFEILSPANGPVYTLALLRLNRNLVAPTLYLESLVAKQMSNIVPNDVGWALFHTFVPKELLVVVNSDSWSKIDEVLSRLTRSGVGINGETLPAYELVENWPCLSREAWNQFSQGRADESLRSLLDEEVSRCRALRVLGTCQKRDGFRYECCHLLDERVVRRSLELNKMSEARWRRPVTGVFQDREVDRPASTFRHLLEDVKFLRENCGSSDSCCSVYMARTAIDSSELAALDRPSSGCDSEEQRVNVTADFPVDLLNGPVSIRPERQSPSSGSASAQLNNIRSTQGSEFIGFQLEKVRDAVRYSMNNPYVAPEFADLSGYLHLVEDIEREYGREKSHQPSEPLRWASLHVSAQNLANYLGYALQERYRDDICGLSHDRHSAPLGASGFSRLAAVGGFSVQKTLSPFAKDEETKSIAQPRLCVIGFLPAYRELGRLPVLNTTLRSTLEPYFYFGLGHEAGHIFWQKFSNQVSTVEFPVLQEVLHLRPPSLEYLSEYLADAFCLFTTFCGNVERYLRAWIRYCLDTLDYDYKNVLFIPSSGDKDKLISDRLVAYAGRLIIAAIVGYLKGGTWTEDRIVCQMATKTALDLAKDEMARRDGTSGTVARALCSIMEDFETSSRDAAPQRFSYKVFADLCALAKRIESAMERVQVDVARSPDACVAAWNRGEIVADPIEQPLAALALLLPADMGGRPESGRSEWARNLAAILSIGLWQEKESQFWQEKDFQENPQVSRNHASVATP